MKLFSQSLIIIITIAFIWIIVNTDLLSYIAYILSFIILVGMMYIFIQRKKKKNQEIFTGSYLEFFAITSVILLTVFITNGFHSSVFFLVYFLLFGISFMFEPLTVFLFMAGLVLLFFPQAIEGDILLNLVRLGSLVLLSPVAFFFGREFKRREKLEKEVQEKTGDIIKNAQDLLKKEGKNVSSNEIEKIGKIVDKAKKLQDKAED